MYYHIENYSIIVFITVFKHWKDILEPIDNIHFSIHSDTEIDLIQSIKMVRILIIKFSTRSSEPSS